MPRTMARYRATRSDTAVAIAVSLAVCVYLSVFGSADIEESTKISYSIAVDVEDDGVFSASREVGTFSHLGVPLYDGLQGTGYRLPYQASWAQSPEWPLRFLLEKQQYLLLRVFLSSFLMLMAALITFRSWRPQASTPRQILFALLLLSPAGLYLRANEWSDTYSQSVAIAGISLLLLRRGSFVVDDHGVKEPLGPRSEWFILFGCVALITTGHPGVWPIAIFVLLPLVSAIVLVSPHFRRCLGRIVLFRKIETLAVTMPALVVFGVVAWELVSESAGLDDWSNDRAVTTQGFYADQALRGFTRGWLPDVLERVASVVAASVVLPLVRVFVHVLPTSDFVAGMTNAWPRGEFAGTFVWFAAITVLLRSKDRTPERSLILVVVSVQVVAFLFAVTAANDLLPLLLSPSGAWQLFPVLLSLNVLMTSVVLGATTGKCSWPRILASINVAIIALWILMQFAFLPIYPMVHLAIPERFTQVALTPHETKEVKTRLGTAGRALFLTSADYTEQRTWQEYIKIVSTGKSVVVPSDSKIRNSNQLFKHTLTNGTFTRVNWSLNEIPRFDELLDFLEVEQVLVETLDPIAESVNEYVAFVNQSEGRADYIATMDFAGIDFQVWTRTKFSSSVIRHESSVGSTRCPILEESCPVVVKASSVSPTASPRLSVCKESCLWRYRTDGTTDGELLVVPVSFDRTLVVRDSWGNVLKTLNVGGYLGVSNESNLTAGAIEISVSPDARMYARILASYTYLGALIVLSLVLFVIPKKNNHQQHS